MESIKTEPEFAWTIPEGEYEGKYPKSEDINSLDLNISRIKEELAGSSCDGTSKVKIEDTPIPVTYPVLKSEDKELKLIKEEPAWGYYETVKLEIEEGIILEQSLEEQEVKHKYDEVLEQKTENENPSAPYAFTAVNQQEEGLHDAISVKEELNLEEVTQGRKVSAKRMEVTYDPMPSRVTWNLNDETLQMKKPISLSMNGTSASGVTVGKGRMVNEIPNQLCWNTSKLRAGNFYVEENKSENSGETVLSKTEVVEPLKCNICAKSFINSRLLNVHLKKHDATPLKCKVFTNSSHLLTNRRIHKLLKCKVCGRCFSELAALKEHLRIHSDDKPFKSNACGKELANSGFLKGNLRLNSDVKPLKCLVCGKAFAAFCNLNVHFRMKTGIIPFKCDVCERIFPCSRNPNAHSLIYSSDKTLECDICG